jgi:hypothetical protein
MTQFLCVTCARTILDGGELTALTRILDALGKKEPAVMVNGTIYCLAHIPPPTRTDR